MDRGSLLLLLRPVAQQLFPLSQLIITNRFKKKGQDYMEIHTVQLKQNIFPKGNLWHN